MKKILLLLISLTLFTTNIAFANPLKCNAKEPLLCKKAIIEIFRKAGLNQYFIEDGDIILTIDTSSPQYLTIKNTPIGIFIHEYDGVNVVTRELTIKDVVGFQSADSALKGHHPRYGLNVLTTLATTGSFSQAMPELVNAKLPGETNAGPVKVTLVVSRGTAGEKTIEFVLRKNDRSTALSGMQGLGLLDRDFNLAIDQLSAANKYTLSAAALAQLVGVPVSSLQAGDKTTFEYSFSKASEDDLNTDSLDVTSTVAGTASLVLARPKPPAPIALPTVKVQIASKPGATPEEKALLDASNFIGSYTSIGNKLSERVAKLNEIQKLVQASQFSMDRKERIETAIHNTQEAIKMLGGSQQLEIAIEKRNSGAALTPFEDSLLIVVKKGQSTVAEELRSGVLGGDAGRQIFEQNDVAGQKLRQVINANTYQQEKYEKALLAYKRFEEKQTQVAQQAKTSSGLKFYAIDGSSSYASANEFLKAHGQINKQTGSVKSFDELTRATPNPNHGGSLGYQHFGGSPEFLTSKGNPTPKPYWVHEYQCVDAECSAYTHDGASSAQSSDQGRLFRLEHYTGLERKALETLIMDGNLEGADPSGRLIQKVGNRVFIFEPLHKDPATTWQPELLHAYNQAVSGSGPRPVLPSDLSGFSVSYQVCGPAFCKGIDERTGSLTAKNKETSLGIIVEQSGLLQNLQSLGAVGANGKIQGIGSDKDGNILVFTQAPGSSELLKFTFSKVTTEQAVASGLKPLGQAVQLVRPGQPDAQPQIFTITVSDKDGGNTASRFPGIVTEEKIPTLIDAGVISRVDGKLAINGKLNPDGSVTAPVLLEGTEFNFTFHPGIHAGSTALPAPIVSALNKQQVTKFFNPDSAESTSISALNAPAQVDQKVARQPSTSSQSSAQGVVLQAHASHVYSKIKEAALSLSQSHGVGETLKDSQKARHTISFAHTQAPDTHVDVMNLNQHFITPSAGHQIELKEAPKFIDSNNKQWLCMVSGLGHRISINQDSKSIVHGHAETLVFFDPAIRDIPGARHNTSSHCLISINHN